MPSIDAAECLALYTRLLEAWNRRSAGDFAALFEPDGHAIGFDGSQMNGRAEIAPALNAPVSYANSGEIRSELAAAMAGNAAYAGLATIQFARPVSAQHWLQASNPSERWKWDFMFQDLPPVKFAGTPRATSAQHLRIPLQKVD